MLQYIEIISRPDRLFWQLLKEKTCCFIFYLQNKFESINFSSYNFLSFGSNAKYIYNTIEVKKKSILKVQHIF